MTELLWLGAFAAASYGAGSVALQRAGFKLKSFGEEALFAQALGLVMLAYATLFLGMLGILGSGYYKIAVAVIILLTLRRLKQLLMHLYGTLKESYNSRQKLNSMLILGLAFLAAFNIMAALAPVHASDAAAYHVAIPKIYAQQGAISFIPFMVTSAYPMATEMLFLDGYLLGGGKASQLIAAYIAILAAIAIYLFAKKQFGQTTALVAAAIFYTMPIVSVFNIRGFVDISTALYGILAVFALLNWHSSNEKGMLALSGIFAGAAASTKISAYPIAAVIFLAVAYIAIVLKRQSKESAAKSLAIYSIPAAILVLPWLTRAFDYTGNPFYPLMPWIFGGTYLPEGLARFWVESLSFIGFGTGITDLALMPWNITMHSTAFGEQLGIGPMFLAFIPLLLLIKKVERKIVALLAMALILLLAWFYTAQSLRYIFFVYALLSVIAAYSITKLLSVSRMKLFILGAVALTLAINAALWIGANNDELLVVAGITEEGQFLSSKMSNYELLKFANSNLKGAKLCLYGEIRGYYSDNEYVWCHPLFQAYIDFYSTDSSEKVLERMKEAGITHLVVEHKIQTFEHYSSVPISKAVADNAERMISEITEAHARKIYENEKGAVYEILYN